MLATFRYPLPVLKTYSICNMNCRLSTGSEYRNTAVITNFLYFFFFIIDELDKAYKKLKKCEEFSDIQFSASENGVQMSKRQRKPNLKYVHSSSEEEDNTDECSFRRP